VIGTGGINMGANYFLLQSTKRGSDTAKADNSHSNKFQKFAYHLLNNHGVVLLC